LPKIIQTGVSGIVGASNPHPAVAKVRRCHRVTMSPRHHATSAPAIEEDGRMQLGMVGLGRMGANIVRRIMNDGHTAVVFDTDPSAVEALAADGAQGTNTLADFVAALDKPRTIWVMIPAGITTKVIN
jgi:phosphoglycerate dehydrogenase-like enzyme